MPFSALPFADQARSHIQIGRKDGLTRVFTGTQRADFFGSHLLNGCQAKRVELAHGLLVHSAHFVQSTAVSWTAAMAWLRYFLGTLIGHTLKH